MEKSTISITIFNSYVSHYQRVSHGSHGLIMEDLGVSPRPMTQSTVPNGTAGELGGDLGAHGTYRVKGCDPPVN